MGRKVLTFKESFVETIYRLPLYASTIIFRVGSICLEMAYLRYYSLIPLTILFVMQTMITWTRRKQLKLHKTFQLVVSNIGVVNAYSRFQTETTVAEDEKNVVKFIKHSAIATFTFHSTMLIIIMIIGHSFPTAMEHWYIDPCNFPLQPGMQSFFWVLAVVLFMGLYSLTAIIYRAPLMAQVDTIDSEHDEDDTIGVSLEVQASDVIDKFNKAVQTETKEFENNKHEAGKKNPETSVSLHGTEEAKTFNDKGT